MRDSALTVALKRDRVVVIVALATLVAVAWSYILWLAADVGVTGPGMSGMRMIPAGIGLMAPALSPWHWYEIALVLVMWIVMMIGMMTPSAAPMILIYARVARSSATPATQFAAVGWFVAGYLSIWSGFSLAATAAQWALQRAALLDPNMAANSRVLGALVLIAAGIYQWTSLKQHCLRLCQAPFVFIQQHGGFRRDARGALLLGSKHGAYCLGCCWALMTLLFVGGVMNVLWIAAIAILVLAEKLLPPSWQVTRISGSGFILYGSWLLLRSAV